MNLKMWPRSLARSIKKKPEEGAEDIVDVVEAEGQVTRQV